MCCGGQLELMCTTTTVDSFLAWTFAINNRTSTGPGRSNDFTHHIDSTGSIKNSTVQLIFNSIQFRFSSFSAENSSLVMSQLLIGPVSVGLNGTEIFCIDLESINNSTLTVLSATECHYPGTCIYKLHYKIFTQI